MHRAAQSSLLAGRHCPRHRRRHKAFTCNAGVGDRHAPHGNPASHASAKCTSSWGKSAFNTKRRRRRRQCRGTLQEADYAVSHSPASKCQRHHNVLKPGLFTLDNNQSAYRENCAMQFASTAPKQAGVWLASSVISALDQDLQYLSSTSRRCVCRFTRSCRWTK